MSGMRDDTESAPADAIVLVKPRGDALPASARPSIPPVLVWLVVPAYFLLADVFLVPGMCIWVSAQRTASCVAW